jgi:hypothetical protein
VKREATLLISMHGTAELRRNRMAAQLVERCRAVQYCRLLTLSPCRNLPCRANIDRTEVPFRNREAIVSQE